jgi:hypothetical protein
MVMPPVALQAALLLVTVLACQGPKLRSWPFPLLACGVTLLVYVGMGWYPFQNYASLRDKYPYVSMQDRLPARTLPPLGSLPPGLAKRLDLLENVIERSESSGANERREWSLRRLHEQAVETFADQLGFGRLRMPTVSALALASGLRVEPALPQPGSRLPPASLAASLGGSGEPGRTSDLEQYLAGPHLQGVADFVHPAGFGYVKDRQHVAGFQAHQFSQAPQIEQWRLQTLDLIGLLLREEPVVYVSDHLPRMDELRDAPTRPPDDFEVDGLVALRRGEDLFVRAGGDGGRALGAVRATKQCLSCHDCKRGDLLGAFSYTFADEKR